MLPSIRRGFSTALAAVAATVFALGASGCGHQAAPPPADAHGAAHEKHWGYEDGPGEIGPAKWGELPGDGTCSAGLRQSPIALSTSGERAAAPAGEPRDAIAYKPSKVSLVNNGHTVQQNYDGGSSLVESGTTYTLAQFHFHTPSEHTLDGQSFPLEIHFVHLDANGKPALVVGVLVKQGAENAALQTVLASFPGAVGAKSEPAGATVNAAALLPGDRGIFAYDGSLTTPPCTEGIRWRVMRQPIEASAAQIEKAVHTLKHPAGTNRPVQPVNGRPVTLVAGP